MELVDSQFFNKIQCYRNTYSQIGDSLLINNSSELQLKIQPSTQKIQTTSVVINKNKKKGRALINNLQIHKNLCYFSFKGLTDIFGVDNINNDLKVFNNKVSERFSVIYNLTSFLKHKRFSIVYTWGTDKILNSLASIFCGASWVEREVWDMFGIFFNKHNNLRRILTDYGFSGFPLRKDFPVTGYFEVRYDDEIKAVVYDKITLAQENRTYDLPTPWEGYVI
jgi:NADH:ubiquinone oxidoreductase subunit C